jgi:hypothetical protein
MSRGPHRVRKGDITKVVQATVAAGVRVRSVEVDADGKIVVIADNADGRSPDQNEWDGVK